MTSAALRLIKRVAHSTIAPAIWPTRHIGPGTRYSWLPRGRRLSLSDLRDHVSISTSEIYPGGRIHFSPLWLDEPRRARTLEEIADDDFTNERKVGLVCRVSNGRLIHGDYVLTPEDDFFADVRFPRVIMPRLSNLEALRLPKFGRAVKYRGTALYLDSFPNLYHCLFDAVGRVAMAKAAGLPVTSFDYFVSAVPKTDLERQLLNIAGVDISRIIPSSPHMEFDRLVFSPLPFGVNGELCRLVRSQCAPLVPKPAANFPRRIFLSRGPDVRTRKILNEKAVVRLLEGYGVQSIVPHHYDLSVQRAIFENSELIVSAHGAGLANLLWTSPGTRVIELRATTHVRGYWKLYWNLSTALRLRHAWVCCEPSYSEPGPRCASGQYDDLTVPLPELERALAAFA